MKENSQKGKKMAKWLSIPNGGLGETGLKDLGTSFKDKDILSSLVRESVQNSLDAKRDDVDTVSMNFDFCKTNAYTIPGVHRLRQIFNYCQQFVTSAGEKAFFKQGKDVVLDGSSGQKSLGVLRIGDHGTIGLTGMKDFHDKGRFRGLVTRMGMGNDDGLRGGNFGVGKQALFLASKIHTVIFSSVDSQTGYSGHMGVAKLSSFRDPDLKAPDGTPLCADRTVYYSDESYNPAHQRGNPVIGGQFLPALFNAGRSELDYGTDVFIIGFEPHDEKRLSNDILTVLMREFIISIAERKLVVTLPDGFRLSGDSIDRAYKKFLEGSPGIVDKRLVAGYVELLRKEWKKSPAISVGPGIDAFPEGAIHYKFVKSDDDNICKIVRGKGMFVHSIKNVCGNSSCIGVAAIRDAGTDRIFKEMENESHVKFEVTDQRFSDRAQRDEAKARLKALEEFLKKQANEEMGTKIESQMEAVLPDELEELMSICEGPITVGEIKEKGVKSGRIGGVRVKKRNFKPDKAVRAVPSGFDTDNAEDDNGDHGVRNTGKKSNRGRHGNPGGHRRANPNSLEENGYAMRPLDIAPVFYANGAATSGRYKVSFTVPRSKAKVCLCFSATTEADTQERLDVRSVTATGADGEDVSCSVDLDGTAIAFENVEEGMVINAEVEFDISYYCYSQVRYYEKKNN